jgi:alcohol dehydrogenase (quinone), cytochrome c subunit
MMQEKALSSSDGKVYLSGGSAVDGWIPPSLRNEHGGGLASWSESDIVQLLKTARNPPSATFGGMNDVVVRSTQHLVDNDLSSIAAYLKTLSPNKDAAPFRCDDTAAKALFNGDASTHGAQLYVDRCAGCHRRQGLWTGVPAACRQSPAADNRRDIRHQHRPPGEHGAGNEDRTFRLHHGAL